MPKAGSFQTHQDYFCTHSVDIRALLEQIQQEVETQLPQARRCISYKMPAFKHRRVFFFFAAFKKHIGVYPPVTEDRALIEETAAFRGPKGNLSFPYSQELPIELIGRVAKALAAQYG